MFFPLFCQLKTGVLGIFKSSFHSHKQILRDNLLSGECDKYVSLSKHVAEQNGQSLEITKRKYRVPKNLSTYIIITESIYIQDETRLPVNLRQKILYPVLDKCSGELNRRFSDTKMALFKAIGALKPETGGFLDKQTLAPLAKHYKSNVDDFQMKVQRMRRVIERKTWNKHYHFLVKIS